MEKEQKDKNDDLDSLLPGKKIVGYTLHPWTLKNLKELYPTLMAVIEIFKTEKITFNNIGNILEKNPKILLDVAIEHGAMILAKTLNISIEEAENIELGKSVELMFNIFFMNIEFIKNSLGLVEQAKEAMISTRP